jgi:3D-(3,5/4)-trihydroxycyclohexane-1,2-dione acylhydrolase (decyclizing)
VWHVPRPLPDAAALGAAVDAIRRARRPLVVAGGGVVYSEATDALRTFCGHTGIPVGETQAGKGSLPYDHPSSLGAVGATGTFAANRIAADADLVIGIGTRYSDFTTASKTAFRNPDVRFVNVNVAEFDAAKHAGIALIGDARATLEQLAAALDGFAVAGAYREECARLAGEWDKEVARLYAVDGTPLAQSAVIGAVNAASRPQDVVVCAAGSMPGDLHKLWRTRDPKGYHVEYGYSCMGYEIPGGMGVKLAAPERDVYVLVGDGSYLMLPGELVTAVEQNVKLTIVLVDNRGYASIGSLSRSLGTDGFGTALTAEVDLAANAASLGAHVVRAESLAELRDALEATRGEAGVTVIAVATDRARGVPSYESWWDVPVAEVSETATVRAAREEYEHAKLAERRFL